MSSKDDFYFRSIARRWQKELAHSTDSVLLFSPYLTSPTAERVTKSVDPTTCQIFTRFDPLDFAQGSSSVKTLKQLCAQGFALYAIANLHAKLVVVPGRFASLGSQNITAGGTRNLEASVVFTEPGEVAIIEKLARSIADTTVPITQAMIEDLENGLPALRKQFRKVEVAAETLKGHVAERESRRQAIARLQLFRSAIKRLPKANEVVLARVSTVSSASWDWMDVFSSSDHATLLGRKDLTRWLVSGNEKTLTRMNRYLCLRPSVGWIGWARVGKTRITYVEREIAGLDLRLGNFQCKLTVLAKWHSSAERVASNLDVQISLGNSQGELLVRSWFSLDELSNVIVDPLRSSTSSEMAALATWIAENEREFSAAIVKQVTQPFRYEHSLVGSHADTFFGLEGSRYRLTLHMSQENPLIVAVEA